MSKRRTEADYNELIVQMENRGWEYAPKTKGGRGIPWRSTMPDDGGRVMWLKNWDAVEKYIDTTPEDEDTGRGRKRGAKAADEQKKLTEEMAKRDWVSPYPSPSGKVFFYRRGAYGTGSSRTMVFDNWDEVRVYVANTKPVPVETNYCVHKMMQDFLTLMADYPTPVYVKVGRDGAFLPLEHMMCDYINGKRSVVLIARGTEGGAE